MKFLLAAVAPAAPNPAAPQAVRPMSSSFGLNHPIGLAEDKSG